MPSWFGRLRDWRRSRRSYYMLEIEALRPGDIIFSTERHYASFFIRMFTRSKFSHAVIYLGDGQYAEAEGGGVRVRAATTVVKERLKVIRLKGGANSAAAARSAADNINDYMHSPYALGSASLSLLGGVPSGDPRALFCSQLVAKAYADAGVAVAKGLDASKVTPEILSTSPLFEDVTEAATFNTRAVPRHLIDGNFKTLSDPENDAIEAMYRELRPFFEENNIPIPGQWHGMLRVLADLTHKEKQRELDLHVMKAMKNSGYVFLLGAKTDEAIKPFANWLGALDPSTLTRDELALEIYSLTSNRQALKRQIGNNRDNRQFWAEEAEKTGVKAFVALSKFHEVSEQQELGMLALMDAALDKLGVTNVDPEPRTPSPFEARKSSHLRVTAKPPSPASANTARPSASAYPGSSSSSS